MVEKPYLFANDRPRRRADVIALAQEAEARDFPGLFSESPGDNLALSLALLDRTKRIAVGTGIAGIYLRHSHTMATGASLIEELHPGRFLLGLGTSHIPFHEEMEVPNIRRVSVPALPPYLIEPIWQQLVALLPERHTSHPLGCHRPRIPDRIVFEKLVQVLVFGCAYEKIAEKGCSATTLRRRRDEWIASAAQALGLVVEGASVHLDRGYDSDLTRERLLERGLVAEISQKGRPAPLNATRRWVVERTNSWQNAHKKLVWCTERRGRVVDFWVTLSEVIIIVRRLVREGWMHYRWEGRPSRRP